MKYLTLLAALTLAGCAGYQPIIDTQGVDPYTYQGDLKECQDYAEQVDPGSSAVAGALIGALLGLAASAIAGTSYHGEVAGLGALMGGTQAGGHGVGKQLGIVQRCLAGRGYSILG